MDRITDRIWIGNYLDAKDRDALAAAGIHSILSLDGSQEGVKAEDAGMVRIEVIELIDGAGNPPEKFLRAVRLLRELATQHHSVLVQCHAGRSRSAAVVCKYFMMTEGLNLGAAMTRIASARDVTIIAGLQAALDFE